MRITLPLEKMTTEDKIRAMETIWNDLCEKDENIVSPSWHKDILEEREKAVESGEEEFVDWSEEKRQIEDKIS